MLRRIVSLVLAALLLAAVPAVGESGRVYYGTMMVDNCEEWVSLRDSPGTGCGRLAKVPLYAIVTDAEWTPVCGDFIYCAYDGQYGYILAKYLVPWADPEPEDTTVVLMDETLAGLRIRAFREMVGKGEKLTVVCEEESGAERWRYETSTGSITELFQTFAFLGGPAQDPAVMVYNAEVGLTALDAFCGDERWTLSGERLGAGNSWAVDGEGNTYIGGYYGPDPVAIDAWGNVKWRADAGDSFWLYRIELSGGELVCTYDALDGDAEKPGRVRFDAATGALLEKVYD